MEFIRSKKRIETGELRVKIAGLLLLFSRLGLAMMIIVLPMHYRWNNQIRDFPPVYEDYTSFYIYLTDIFLLFTLGSWLLSLALAPRRLSLRPHLLTGSLTGLVGISAISIYSSYDRWLSIYTVLRLLLAFGLYLYLINESISLAFLVLPLGLQIGIQAPVALGQVFLQHSLGLVKLKELTLDPSAPGISIVWKDGVRFLRAYGLTDHPNVLGGSLALALLLLVTCYLAFYQSNWAGKAGRMGFMLFFALGTLALVSTFSRSAWLALAVGLIYLAAWFLYQHNLSGLKRLAGVLVLIIALILPAAVIASPLISTRLNLNGSFQAPTPENQSIYERSLLLSQAEKITAQHPFLGVGLGAYTEAFHMLVPNYPFPFQPPHIVAGEVAAETGLPGLFLYLITLLAPWVLLLINRSYKLVSLPLAGVTAALLAICLISLLDYYPWLLNPGRNWQWLIWGLWGSWFQAAIKGVPNG